jgi:hypothetical protein
MGKKEHLCNKNKCKKCCLSFQKPEQLREHIQKDHISFVTFEGLEPAPSSEVLEELMMPKPDEKKRRKGPPVFMPSMYPCGTHNVALLKSDEHPSVTLAKVQCRECRRAMDVGHLKTAWSCSHCRYGHGHP